MSDTTGDALALPTPTPHENTLPSITPERLADGRFAPGHTNISPGRPPGARNRSTIEAEALMAGEAKTMSDKMITLALGGDSKALKFCLERVIPRATSRAVIIAMPSINTQADVTTAQSALIDAMARGEINPTEAKAMASVLEMKRRSLESVEFEARLNALEQQRAVEEERAGRA